MSIFQSFSNLLRSEFNFNQLITYPIRSEIHSFQIFPFLPSTKYCIEHGMHFISNSFQIKKLRNNIDDESKLKNPIGKTYTALNFHENNYYF